MTGVLCAVKANACLIGHFPATLWLTIWITQSSALQRQHWHESQSPVCHDCHDVECCVMSVVMAACNMSWPRFEGRCLQPPSVVSSQLLSLVWCVTPKYIYTSISFQKAIDMNLCECLQEWQLTTIHMKHDPNKLQLYHWLLLHVHNTGLYQPPSQTFWWKVIADSCLQVKNWRVKHLALK